MLQLRPWLREYMREHDLSALQVGLSAGYSSNTPISSVLRGERPVPLERLDEWCRALHLRGEDLEVFKLLVHLDMAPEWLQQEYWRMRAHLDVIMRENEKAQDRLQAYAARLALAEQRVGQLEDENRQLKRQAGA